MDNRLIKHIISNISSDEISVLRNKLIKEKDLSEKDKSVLTEKMLSLHQSHILCSPYITADVDFNDLLTSVGISNVCRYFNNLCSQYERLQGNKWDEKAINQDYLLEFNQKEQKLPLSTRAGDPSEYINGIIGIYSSITLEDTPTVSNAFKDTGKMLKTYIETINEDELPCYENMNSEKVRKSLNILVDRGLTLIDSLIKEVQGEENEKGITPLDIEDATSSIKLGDFRKSTGQIKENVTEEQEFTTEDKGIDN